MFETSSESETIIIRLAGLLAEKNFLLALVAGVVLAGILACTMSTADSQLLTAASSVSQNLLQDFLKIKMSPKQSMLAARLTVVGISLVAVVLAWNPDSSVFYIVSFAWQALELPSDRWYLFSLFWRRTNFQGALAGMLTGRRDGVCMEIPGEANGRRLGHLRAASGIYLGLYRDCCCVFGNCGSV